MLASELNYTPSLFFFSLSATDPLMDLEVGTSANAECGGGGEGAPPTALSPEHKLVTASSSLWVLFVCLFMDVCDLCCFFSFQATKGLEKGTGNCICGTI